MLRTKIKFRIEETRKGKESGSSMALWTSCFCCRTALASRLVALWNDKCPFCPSHYLLALQFLATQSILPGVPTLEKGAPGIVTECFHDRVSSTLWTFPEVTAQLWSTALGNRLYLMEAVQICFASPDHRPDSASSLCQIPVSFVTKFQVWGQWWFLSF